MQRSDLETLRSLKNESWFGTHNTTLLSKEEQEEWYEGMIGDPDNMVLMASVDQEITGDSKKKTTRSVTPHVIGVYKISNIDWMNQRYDSAYDVLKESRGQGFGPKVLEAGVDFGFEILNMHRLETEVLENNVASQKCMDAVGCRREGVKRQCVHKCDQWLDSWFYGLLRNHWRKLERVKAMDGVCNVSYTPKDGN